MDASSPAQATDPRLPLASAAGLLVISAAILSMEVLQTRLFSYCINAALIYAAISVALLGLGASGTVLSLWQGWRKRSFGSVAAISTSLFAISLVASHAFFASRSSELTLRTFGWNALTIGLLASLAVPYFFAGTTVTLCLSRAGSRVHRAYFVNMVGSALGCFVMFAVLKPLGAPKLLAAISILCVLSAILFLYSGSGRFAQIITAIGGIVAGLSLGFSDRLFDFKPEPEEQLQVMLDFAKEFPKYRGTRLYDAWDPTGRIELYEFDNAPAKVPGEIPCYFYAQDSGAGSIVLEVRDDVKRASGFFERTVYGGVYHMRGDAQTNKALVIGLGGGPDILAAEYFGVDSVTGVEINASSIEALKGPLAETIGNAYNREGVELVHMDGRSWVRSTKDKYDLIVMSGVDTKAVTAADALAISENNLYTLEAFGEYFDHLNEGGHVAMIRFGWFGPLRACTIGVEALRRRGVENPEDHFAVIDQGMWTLVIMGRSPITDAQKTRLADWIASVPGPDNGIRIPVYGLINLPLNQVPRRLHPNAPPNQKGNEVIGRYFGAVAAGRDQEFIDGFPVNVAPIVDDRPFFFDPQRPGLKALTNPGPTYKLLLNLIGILAALAAVFIALPPLIRRGTRTGGGTLRTVLYFCCLGMGFMVLELGFVQRLVLLLGHQTYSITVVLASLLVSAGIGSLIAGGFDASDGRLVRRIAVPLILIFGLGLHFALELGAVAAASLPLPTRIAITAGALFPLGLALGIPFPAALSNLRRSNPARVPWAIGANGFASVVGASLALPIAKLVGYQFLLFLGLGIYVVAAFSFPVRTRTAE